MIPKGVYSTVGLPALLALACSGGGSTTPPDPSSPPSARASRYFGNPQGLLWRIEVTR